MSLDIIIVDKEGNEIDCYLNITHNLNKIADALGFYELLWRPEETKLYFMERVKCSDMIDHLYQAYLDTCIRGEKYAHLLPDNGWGTLESLKKFLLSYIEACGNNLDCYIIADR